METIENEEAKRAGPRPVESTGEEDVPFCIKPFAPETARMEDEDSPCRNGEG